ncbi:MAG: hypothetical protein FWE15_27330 [Actinomycetia bacterium]|nr:hypothetical protein [Actinomycetes bacterium]MCL2733710.1 hypothetical protein [Actinomycetes bacterium]
MDAGGYAAWAAAVTSAATLVVTTLVGGRREQHRWARDALTDAFVAFLAASWRHSDVARTGPPGDPAVRPGLAREYGEMRSQLTRLRLLTSDDVVATGERLLHLQRRVQEAETPQVQSEALEAVSEARMTVVAAAKKAMGLA